MKAGYGWWIVLAVALGGTMSGCSSAGKQSGASLAAVKSDNRALRTAVEKDPFPHAQGLLAAGKSRTSSDKR